MKKEGRTPETLPCWLNCIVSKRKTIRVLAILDKGMQVLPQNKTAFKAERVNVLLDTQRLDEAKVALDELITLDPKNAQYALNLGILNDNEVNQLTAEIKKLAESSKKTGSVDRKIKEAEETDKVFADEIKRISGLIAKQPKNADLKRQKPKLKQSRKKIKLLWKRQKANWLRLRRRSQSWGIQVLKNCRIER